MLTILSYLGWDSYPVARLGSDLEGRGVIADMRSWGVRTEFVGTEAELDTPRIIEQVSEEGARLWYPEKSILPMKWRVNPRLTAPYRTLAGSVPDCDLA